MRIPQIIEILEKIRAELADGSDLQRDCDEILKLLRLILRGEAFFHN